MPATGVYPYTSDLWETLIEEYSVVTNRTVLADILIEPILDLHQDYINKQNPFICRERYRNWLEQVQEHIGAIDLPDWETIIQHDDWPYELLQLIEADGDYEWELFFDQRAEIATAIAELNLSEPSAETLLEKLAAVSHPNYFVALCVPNMGVIYVVHSDEVANCGPCVWKTYEGFHVFDDIADGCEPGPFDTYVLPQHVYDSWKTTEAAREQEYQIIKQHQRTA